MDPTWGHLTIKMSGHPPFGAQVILNGHEYVACAAHAAEIGFAKEGNCFTGIGEPGRLAQIADTLSQPGTAGRLGQVIDAWIYTACLCFGLDLAEQQASHFTYSYAVYQVEYSRNLIFGSGARMERLFDAVIDRVRTRLDLPAVRTLFGVGRRPLRPDPELSPRQGVVILRPQWNLTIFKIHFGLLTVKAYTKGERVLRFEAIVHNTKTLRTGRALGKFGAIVARLAGMVDRFTTMLDCVDSGFLPDGILDRLPTPSQIGAVRVGGLDTNKPRTRAAMSAITALAIAPDGFSVADLAANVHTQTGQPLHHPAGRLRPAKTPRQEPRRQTRTRPPLPDPRGRRPDPQRHPHPPRSRHRPRSGRRPETRRPTPQHLHPDRPRLRHPPHQHASPVQRPRHRHRRIDNKLSIEARKLLVVCLSFD